LKRAERQNRKDEQDQGIERQLLNPNEGMSFTSSQLGELPTPKTVSPLPPVGVHDPPHFTAREKLCLQESCLNAHANARKKANIQNLGHRIV
jgi:hypothetical protein